ncbi:MAG: glycosyltransferase family 4 protein [Thermoplasmatales archaeon]|nr:glycosyltransferase family 4 protein [Thermoplasmatales archaeon]
MRRVAILRRPPEREEETSGVGAYSDMLEEGLARHGVGCDRIVVNPSVRYGVWRLVTDGFVRPFLKSLGAGYDAIHATDEFCCLYFPLMKGRKVVTFHHISKGMEGKSPFYMLVWRIISKIAVRQAHTIVAVSEQTRDELITDYGVPPEKIKVLTHAPPYDFNNLGLERDRVIGCVSSLIERKNVAGAIRAFWHFTKLPGTEGYRFVICGNGPLRPQLEGLAKELGIADRVEFVSDLSRDELERFYNTMAVYANPSMHEGLGLTPLEAQTCGTPVVSFADAKIPAEVSGGFVKSSDEEGFARNMHLLVTNAAFRENVVSDLGRDPDFGDGYLKRLVEIYFE